MPGPKMIESGLQHGQRLFRESQKAGRGPRVLGPDDPMYHGRIGKAPEADRAKLRDAWEKAHDRAEDDAQFYLEGGNRWRRKVAITGGAAAGIGYLQRKAYQSQNKKLRQQLGVKKGWSRDEPFMIDARGDKVPHVTTMGARPQEDLARLPWRARMSMSALKSLDKGKINRQAAIGVGAVTGASLAGIPFVYGPHAEHKRLRAQAKKRGIRKGLDDWVNFAERVKPEHIGEAAEHVRRTLQGGKIEVVVPKSTRRQIIGYGLGAAAAGGATAGASQGLVMRRRKKSTTSKGYLPEAPLGNIPRYAIHRTRGKVRVIAYHPKHMTGHEEDRFTVHDTKRNADVTIRRSEIKAFVNKALVSKENRDPWRYTEAGRGGRLQSGRAQLRGLTAWPKAQRAHDLAVRFAERGDLSEQKRALHVRNLLAARAAVGKALRDPKKAYEGHVKGAQAKGETPLSYEAFLTRAEGAGAKQQHREAETAAQKEARQHTIIPETHPWRGKPLTRAHIGLHHVARGQVRNAATSGLLAAGALSGLAYSQHQRKQATAKRDNRRDVNTTLGAVGGAATMDALNTVGGQSAKAVLKERRNRRGVTPHEQKVWGEHKRKMMGLAPGQKVPTDDSIPQHVKAKTFMHYPKALPDWKAQRALGFKNTKGWTIGSLAGAAATGGLIARRRTKSTTAKSLEGELPRAARRAAKRNLPRLTPEEIAERRKAAEARGTANKPKQEKAKPSPETSVHVRPRSSFLGAGQVRDLAVGVPLGAGALYYGTRKPRSDMVAKGSKQNWANASGALGVGALGAHVAEGEALHRAEREMHRVNAHNNADVPGAHTERKLRRLGINEENAAMRSADRAKHISRGVTHLDNVRYLRNAKGAAAAGALAAGYKAVTSKADHRRAKRTAAGAVGGAALLDAADTVTGASLKRIGANQRDRARQTMTPDERTAMNRDINAHGQKHGFLDERGRGRAPKPTDPHAAKNSFYRSYPKHLPGARVARLNALRDKKTGPVLLTGALLGGGLAERRQVNKALSFSQVGLLTGSGTAGTLIGASGTRRQNESHEAVGALAGGWAGQGLYQGAGYGSRKLVRGVKDSRVPLHERDVPKSRMKTPEQRKAYDRFRRERRKLAREYPAKVDQKRHTPRSWHGARTERVLAHTHGGRLGTAIGTGATALGVGAGLKAAQRYDSKREVGKSVEYGYQTKERSWPKTAEMIGGLGLLGYGVPRIKALGPASEKGVKFAEKHGAGKEARAVQELARALGQRSNEVTGRGEARLRQIAAVDRAISKVPKSVRGELATAAGVLLASHAHPTTKNRFVPIGRQ